MGETAMSGSGKESFLLNDIHMDVRRTLVAKCDMTALTAEFRALNSNTERVYFAYEILKQYDLLPQIINVEKSDEKSEDRRKYGNHVFAALKRDHTAMKHYNKSVAYAKSDEIVAYAYANRSAVLFQNKLYKECLIDIEYAFENGYPEHLHAKLNERRDKAQKQLEESEETPKEDYFTKVPAIEENRNEKFECASDSIEMQCTEDMGRHLVATKQIEPGDIIAVEKSYTNILLYNFYLTHCHHCLLVSYNLIPCCECPLTLYCSKTCRDEAWARYHQYECSLLDTLHSIEATKLQLLALRVVLCARKDFPQILKDEVIDEEGAKYKSECYKEIHNLITNEEHRPVNELFARSTVAAVLFHLLHSTSFFNDLNDGIDVEEIKKCTAGLLLRHLQTAPSNMHEISEFQGNVDSGYEIVEIGAGAYAFMSLLNHSCAPNVIRHCHGTTIVLRALRPIEIGQQLYDNYGYHHALMVRDERRSHLKEQYWFTCECEACVNDWPLYNSFPAENADLVLDENELSALSIGNREMAQILMSRMIEKSKGYTTMDFKKYTEILDTQEILKQCFAVFGNKHTIF